MKWANHTAYGYNKNQDAQEWELEHQHLQITIHKKIGQNGWFFSSKTFCINDQRLSSYDLEEAQKEVISRLFEKADFIKNELSILLSGILEKNNNE